MENKSKESDKIINKAIFPHNIILFPEKIKDSLADWTIDNTFIAFISMNDILYLIYSNRKRSIICYDLKFKKKIIEIKECHRCFITNFRHHLDEINKRDLIMSISGQDNNLKIWNSNNWECILNLTKINKSGYLESACFFQSIDEIYVITSNYNSSSSNIEPIKVYNLNGKKTDEIKNSKEHTFFTNIYYDNSLSKHYLITCNCNFSRSYKINDPKGGYIIYKTYKTDQYEYTYSAIILNDNGLIKLIESCSDGAIRIFNFHSGLPLNTIKINNSRLYGMCLWNDDYLFVGCQVMEMKLVEIKAGLVVKSFSHEGEVLTIKKIISKDKEYLVSQSQNEIKFWKII